MWEINLAGMLTREINEKGEKLYSIDEVFPNMHPGLILKGARNREGLTQIQLAKKISVKPRRISEIETGKRPIDKEMAKHLSKALNTNYKIFL
ncbi:hypothetical protein GMMP1_780003 [Candidatus Magnetomoraceae bacterium gMMP-1]